MPGRSTTDAIFNLTQTIEKHMEDQKDKSYLHIFGDRIRSEVPESTISADDSVLCGCKEVDITEYLETRRKSLEERETRVSRPKTKCMDFLFEQSEQGNREPVKLLGEELERVTHFRYIVMSIEEEGGMATEITKRVGLCCRNWKNCNAVEYYIYDRRMPAKVKRKVCKTMRNVIR